MPKLQLPALLGLFAGLAGCASGTTPNPANYDVTVVQQNDPDHVTVQYNGRCAMAMAQGLMNHPGSSKYRLQLGDKTYYFGSAEARDKFEADLQQNLQAADDHWQHERQLGSAERGGAGRSL